MSITSVIKSIQDIMRKDAGVDGDAQRLGQLSWLLFLKIFDAQEAEKELELDYQASIPEKYLWRNWAVDYEALSEEERAKLDDEFKNKKTLTGDELLNFINNDLLEKDSIPINSNPRSHLVREALNDASNYMKNGTLLRQVINKLNEIDFNDSKDRHLFGDIYEQILSDLQSAGNAGEFYTPRAVTRFIIDRLDPKLGEKLMDPACGTGGFIACATNHVKANYKLNNLREQEMFQQQFHGIEKKQLPHLLCVTNMMLHDIEVPVQIKHGNTLNKRISDWDSDVKVIASNPPFGGTEEDGIEENFSSDMRTRETADLFLQLIVEVLDPQNGRAGVVLPDGTLFGDGVKAKIKDHLTKECNLHTIVRLPNGVFSPYTGIKTNLLFFTKGKPTETIWVYEHPYPEGVKGYSKTKPMKFEEFKPEQEWWGDEADGFAARQETKQAWKIDFKEIKANATERALPHKNKAAELKDEAEVLKIQISVLKARRSEKKVTEEEKQTLEKKIKSLDKKRKQLISAAKSEEKIASDIYYSIFNFDFKNPHQEKVEQRDPRELLAQYKNQQAEITDLRSQLKNVLGEALSNTAGKAKTQQNVRLHNVIPYPSN